jgi:uncharacterized protein
MSWLGAPRWSPYAVGIGIGVLCWLAFLLSDKTLGCSTAFVRSAGMIKRLLHGKRVLREPYFQRYTPTVDWQWMLVVGILAGSFLSAQLSGSFAPRWTPPTWAATFGGAALPRLIVALVGGVLIGLGARWAGGCTSGHGISGTLQLTVSSWLATICFFVGGIGTAFLLFRIIGD